VDKWLARVFFPNRVPEFERNEETLSWLYDLSVISIQRTKEKIALIEAQERMIQEYDRHSEETEKILNTFGLGKDQWDEQTAAALDQLTEIGMRLNVDLLTATTFDIVKAASDRIDEEFKLKLGLQELDNVNDSLLRMTSDLAALEYQLETSTIEQESQQDAFDEKISEWARNTKIVQAKTEEYKSQVRDPKVLMLSI
jgi:hypothetical protein